METTRKVEKIADGSRSVEQPPEKEVAKSTTLEKRVTKDP